MLTILLHLQLSQLVIVLTIQLKLLTQWVQKNQFTKKKKILS